MMFAKDLVDSPIAIPDSFIQFVAGACNLLREGVISLSSAIRSTGVLPSSEPCKGRQL